MTNNWDYERTISLRPATSASDTAVLVNLDPKIMGRPYKGANRDGSDLRFTLPGSDTFLNYWIESWNSKGTSKVWVKVTNSGTSKILMYHGNPKAKSLSNGEAVFDFFDDFNNGIWTKPVDHPVLTPSHDRKVPGAWKKYQAVLCEPSVIFEDGVFKMWYSTESGPWKDKVKPLPNGMAYATSKDGIHWDVYPVHPLLAEVLPDSVSRCYVLKHKGTYYLFASNVEQAEGSIIRWTSKDGIHWTDKVKVLTPKIPEETPYHNPAVFVDDDGIWKMLINTEDRLALATSEDGLHWTKWNNGAGVSIPKRCEGDPFVSKVGDTYFWWHSHFYDLGVWTSGISVHWSKDLIHWEGGIKNFKNPQIAHTQPWERGLGTDDVQIDHILADTTIVEHDGKLWLYYCGTQTQFGVATFDGTLEELAERILHNPPLAKWDPGSMFGMVEDNQLKLSDRETRLHPLVETAATFSDTEGYIFEFRARRYAGASYQIMPVIRYVNDNTWARFWLFDKQTTYYQDIIWKCPDAKGSKNVGANGICDEKWHNWKVVVKGEDNTLYLDGRLIGSCKTIPGLVNRNDLKVGFSVFDTFAAFDDVRVRKYVNLEPVCSVSKPSPASKRVGS